ncbi:ATPase, P-type (transporting), HAD superfamily, subfamily IC/heavy metal translocating P-type ATPase [Butyrivibrio proteoclasticus]|uniref:Cd(2+)-exporting ATPase n=1 Tax=Butyrivibrio proteoclasticus TaxID=43305 RepID=A0A1I5S5Q0_9FIRM|nr:heavy metal translocating P-type ATPase [Butyrivibrio proteoclasticus]SFP66042.1 ATPase, P-type (transporting), HAD superfamily, subfamily IC/heavy metal translocating P-type ATPase [Butyrivibrio proteoclasticus]
MKIVIKHEISGRIRFSMPKRRFSYEEADRLQYYLLSLDGVEKATVYERSADAVVVYKGDRKELLSKICAFDSDSEHVKALVPESTGRELMAAYKEKLFTKIILHYGCRVFLPSPIRRIKAWIMATKFIYRGLVSLFKNKKLEVSVLDATAITVSLLTGDYETASSVMFLLGVGDLLEEWTHKKSVDDLARSMALKADRVWLKKDGTEVQVPISQIAPGDEISVRVGSIIPLDGTVVLGEALVNQATLTGEGIPVEKKEGAYVYAGTVIEEGDIVLKVEKASGATRYEKIIKMIEDSEQLKSGVESRAEHLADKLVPYTLGGTILAYLITRNVTKALSILMVDFSCALKLSMPVTVLSAMRECQDNHLTVKGGKFLEAIADADTIVFDKTGTLTMATPKVVDVVTFSGNDKDEMLRIAACLEEHYPHSIANAVVAEAAERGLEHNEMHSKVEYVVAHGIASDIDGKKVVIGSWHFVMEDEKCIIPEGEQDKLDSISKQYSRLFLAIGGKLAAVICLEDPLRPEAPDVIKKLHEAGFKNIVMMTGDSKHTAQRVAQDVGVDSYYAEVLPEEKAGFVQQEKAKGHTVIMIGDGINDSPALSEADCGIAISEGSQLARQIADVMISEDDLYKLITLKELSTLLMKRIHFNYRFVVGFNLGLISLGLLGTIAPATSAMLHNGSTIALGLHSMTNLKNETESEEIF